MEKLLDLLAGWHDFASEDYNEKIYELYQSIARDYPDGMTPEQVLFFLNRKILPILTSEENKCQDSQQQN